jgi:two-component system, OmpR family, response regulator VicR
MISLSRRGGVSGTTAGRVEDMVSDRDNSSMSERVRKVVCIEDEQEMIELVRLILSRQNIEVVGALGGPEGLERIAEERPDLVLLDLMMPEMDGWEVYQKMKSSEEMRRIPVIVVTAKAQSIDRVLGLHIARVDDYITKPFGPQELLESVQRVMEKNEQVASAGGESERG